MLLILALLVPKPGIRYASWNSLTNSDFPSFQNVYKLQ